jgi:ATP-dependent RNA helicase DDX51/DBP6
LHHTKKEKLKVSIPMSTKRVRDGEGGEGAGDASSKRRKTSSLVLETEEVEVEEEREDDVRMEKKKRNRVLDSRRREAGERRRTRLEIEEEKREEMRRVSLPYWMLHGIIIAADPKEDQYAEVDERLRNVVLAPPLMRTLEQPPFNVHAFFPVQRALIPRIIDLERQGAHGDFAVTAPTGSGKTLAYLVPIVHILHERKSPFRRLRAVIIVPTRDLAIQVHKVASVLSNACGLVCGLCTGQRAYESESAALRVGVDMLIGTPGRILDHMKDGDADLSCLWFLVIDEADRLVQQTYHDWIEKINAALASNMENPAGSSSSFTLNIPRKILCSATLTRNPGKLAKLRHANPRYISCSRPDLTKRYKTPASLEERLVICEDADKPLALLHLLSQELKGRQVVCFTRSVEHAHRLTRLLELLGSEYGGLKVGEYSSALPQRRRERILSDFRRSKIDTLICSDLMSRGLDIESVECVVSYDAPSHIKAYVHRVGRTARAGKNGLAVTILRRHEVRFFKDMLRKADHEAKLKEVHVNSVDEEEREKVQSALLELRDIIQSERK